MSNEQHKREKDLIEWVKLIAAWEIENPCRDWLQEMGTADLEGPGTLPPPPPPPPPGS